MSAMPNNCNKSAETFLRKALKIVDPKEPESSYVIRDVEAIKARQAMNARAVVHTPYLTKTNYVIRDEQTVNETAMNVLNHVIENANGRDVSVARKEYLDLLKQQIKLLEVSFKKASKKKTHMEERSWECESSFHNTDLERDLSDYLEYQAIAEEQDRLAKLCWKKLVALHALQKEALRRFSLE